MSQPSLPAPPDEGNEAKWHRMKKHIADSAKARGMRGKDANAYIFGAMRKRGWRPHSEREPTASILSVSEGVNARVRHNIDTMSGHNAIKGSRDLTFKRMSSRRPGVTKFPVAEEARRWLAEVLDMDYSPHALSGSGVIRGTGKAVKTVAKKAGKELRREVIAPAKSIKRAIKAKRAVKLYKHSHPERYNTVMHRANAVLKNRSLTMAAAGAGWAASPIPGSGEVAAVGAAKGMNRITRARRLRLAARKA